MNVEPGIGDHAFKIDYEKKKVFVESIGRLSEARPVTIFGAWGYYTGLFTSAIFITLFIPHLYENATPFSLIFCFFIMPIVLTILTINKRTEKYFKRIWFLLFSAANFLFHSKRELYAFTHEDIKTTEIVLPLLADTGDINYELYGDVKEQCSEIRIQPQTYSNGRHHIGYYIMIRFKQLPQDGLIFVSAK
jgi:hypothetical protein